jgi:hypothetical protein
MSTYYVTTKEVHETIVKVEAEDKHDAVYKVCEGKGQEYATLFEYYLDTDSWDVRQIEKD